MILPIACDLSPFLGMVERSPNLFDYTESFLGHKLRLLLLLRNPIGESAHRNTY